MSLTTENMGPADIAALTRNNNNGPFGDNGSWFIIILFLFAFLGWGNNGGYGGGVQENYVLTSDFSQLSKQVSDAYAMTERKLDGVNNGLCSGFYQEAQLINGVNMNMANGFAGAELARTNGNMNLMQAVNGIGTQLQQCCCDNRYDALVNANNIQNAVNTGFCQTNFNNQNNTRDLLENQNANARAILDAIQANKVEALKDRIAEQNQTINALNLAASQTAQNAYLIDKLNPNPCPKPAYVVQPPQMVTFPYANNGCGCGC